MEDIVISGVSGRFPESQNVWEFRDHLYNGDDMVTEDDRRWPPELFDMQRRSGKLNELDKFDASFFGVHPKQAIECDPQLRILTEVVYEAIVDAGINPQSIRGSNTGVFTALSLMESADIMTRDVEKVNGFQLLGYYFCMFSNRISYIFDFRGPSFTLDTGCSASLVALDQALTAIRNGRCDAAIVAGTNLCLDPFTTFKFWRIGALSADGKSKSFDASGSGYVRSEAITAIYIQKATSAKRIYAHIVNCMSSNDGYKSEGQTVPQSKTQESLLRKIYTESEIDPNQVVYIETHGTGTRVGDPVEAEAITNVFLQKRTTPLLIGSVKSNMGHAEAASGLCNVVKVLLALETGIIPANLHFNTPHPNIPALCDGRLKIVAENTLLNSGLIGINAIGFGGVNAHLILRPGTLRKSTKVPNVQIFTCSGRTEESVIGMLEHVQKTKDKGFCDLMSDISDHPPLSINHPFRGYTIVNSTDLAKSVQKVGSDSRPVWYVFSGLGTQWIGMGVELMEIAVFRESMMRSHKIIEPYGMDLYELLTNATAESQKPFLNNFMTIVSIQIALVDLLRYVGLEPDGIVGHSLGEIGSAYADGCLTQEQAMMAAYWRGKCVVDVNPLPGSMAVVGLKWEEVIALCPPGVEAVCHNGLTSVTVSGRNEAVKKFIAQLSKDKIFATEINVSSVAFHSKDMLAVIPGLRRNLEKVIPNPKPRSSRWVSSSVLDGNIVGKYASPDYYCNNLVKPVLFYKAVLKIPKNAIVIEIAPHSHFLTIVRKTVGKNATFLSLMKRYESKSYENLLNGIGQLYVNGVQLSLSKLNRPCEYPVPRNTSMISPLVRWDHSDLWPVATIDDFLRRKTSGSGTSFEIDISSPDSSDRYLVDHTVDGRILFPATGYLVLAWKALAKHHNTIFDRLAVELMDVKFERATVLPTEGSVTLTVTILEGDGLFTVSEGSAIACSGKIQVAENLIEKAEKNMEDETKPLILTRKDIYKNLWLRGYEYGPMFKGIIDSNLDGDLGHIEWKDNWIAFLDTVLQFSLLSKFSRQHRLPTQLHEIVINPKYHLELASQNTSIEVRLNPILNSCQCGGISINGGKTTISNRRINRQSQPIVEEYHFVPYFDDACFSTLPEVENEIKTKYCDSFCTVATSTIQKWLHENSPRTKFDVEDMNVTKEDIEHYSSFKEMIKSLLRDRTADNSLQFYKKANFLKPILDIVRDNCFQSNLKITEILANGTNMSDIVVGFFQTQPLVSATYTITCKTDKFSHTNDHVRKLWNVEVESLPDRVDFIIWNSVINGIETKKVEKVVENVYDSLNYGGFFLIVRLKTKNPFVNFMNKLAEIELMDDNNLKKAIESANFRIVSARSDDILYDAYLLRKLPQLKNAISLEIDEHNYNNWVEDLKERLFDLSTNENLWLKSLNQPTCGIVGLCNCLAKEDKGNQIRFVFNSSSTQEEIALNDNITIKDLYMNIYRNGKWGFYCHLPFTPIPITTATGFINLSTSGDISSVKWHESLLKHDRHRNVCYVYYTGLNFRDVMIASGKLALSSYSDNFYEEGKFMGFEYSGRTKSGERIMGMTPNEALATIVECKPYLVWPIPDEWSMEDAGTICTIYSTVFLAFKLQGRLRKGESVLIHCGSGGVGQAAIRFALSYGCTVFTTVGTKEKKEFLKKIFPELKDENFASSRDTQFENLIMIATKGRGVDVILNSLAGEKLQASIRCLAKHGRFLEIGKVDFSKDSALRMSFFLKGASFYGVTLDNINEPDNPYRVDLHRVMSEGIKSGLVQPIVRTIFDKNQVEEAFRYMAAGKHIGKILIKIRDEEESKIAIPKLVTVNAKRMSFCHPDKSYLIIGGLGGFGLELANWLVKRDATNIVLTSRTGNVNGYAAICIKEWRNKGVNVIISTKNVINMSETEELVKTVIETQGPIGGIFNLALVLRDNLMENQTVAKFEAVCNPKILGTRNLDAVSRKLCRDTLDWFVAFSSVSCGLGNAGQTNYGMANSTMERICEQRRREGFPGLAIQWGAVGDVGILQESSIENDIMIGGTVPQGIYSCLDVLDTVLCQDHPVVSSYVLAENVIIKSSGEKTLLETIAHILGIKDVNYLNDESTLADLGVDSVMGIEIKQTLERNYDIRMSLNELRKQSVRDLKKMDEMTNVKTTKTTIVDNGSQIFFYNPKELVAKKYIIKMNEIDNSTCPLFVFHPIEGNVHMMKKLAAKLNCSVYGLQLKPNAPLNSIKDLVDTYLQEIEKIQTRPPYNLCGYSFGCVVMTVLASTLCSKYGASAIQSLTYLEGSWMFLADLRSDEISPVAIWTVFLDHFVNFIDLNIKAKLVDLSDFNQQLEFVIDLIMNTSLGLNRQDVKEAAILFYKSCLLADKYSLQKEKFEIPVKLIRAEGNLSTLDLFGPDYQLNKISNYVSVEVVKGNHTSFLDESVDQLALLINRWIE